MVGWRARRLPPPHAAAGSLLGRSLSDPGARAQLHLLRGAAVSRRQGAHQHGRGGPRGAGFGAGARHRARLPPLVSVPGRGRRRALHDSRKRRQSHRRGLPLRRVSAPRAIRARPTPSCGAGASRDSAMSSELSMALEDLLHPYLGRYLGSPDWLKASAGRAYALLPRRVRLGAAYERFQREVAADAAKANAALALGKLERTLAWALDTVPAYETLREVLENAHDPLEALLALPVTDKLDIKRHPQRFLSQAMPRGARLEMFTGGSTRNPMKFYLQKHVSRSKEYAFLHDFRARLGMGAEDRVLALRGRTVPSAAQPGGSIWMYEPIRRQLILSSDHLEKPYMPAYAPALALHRPTYIEAFPSALYPLAR